MTITDLMAGRRTAPVVMGVLNVTPDSFSDGGRFDTQEAAVRHGRSMRALGADIIDVGGESTRPGAIRIDMDEEIARVVGVVSALARIGAVVSIDTMRADVARAAVEAGASLVNDVSGGLADPQMHATVAALGVPYVVTHWRRAGDEMTHASSYQDCVSEVCTELQTQAEKALDAGIAATRIIVDPGLGFAKGPDDNWALLAGLPQLRALGFPVLVGASRKRFLGSLLRSADDTPRPVDGRDTATALISLLATVHGAWGVRVHNVVDSCDARKILSSWQAGRECTDA